MRGIIPRAIEQVGRYKLQLEAKGWEYAMEVSFIEIYNETVRDLLRDDPVDDARHEIRRDADGMTYVSEVTLLELDPNKKEEIEEVMELAARYRSVSATNMNEQSSRSHSVFTLYLKAYNDEQQVSMNGTLSLVDLAGSERIMKSGATGSQAKEAIQINKSLSALADVFTAIGNKQSFVPFRNSKLTYFLQPALSGEGKTLMVG
jgi:kinesin family protein C1